MGTEIKFELKIITDGTVMTVEFENGEVSLGGLGPKEVRLVSKILDAIENYKEEEES